MFSINDKPECV